MKIEIWSDIVCPFCYIGKRRLEAALAQFAHRDTVEIVWRSFELDAQGQTEPGGSLYKRLAAKYGQSEAWARQMSAGVAQQAAEVGLRFNFDKAMPANTFRAHRLLHLAAHHGRQDAAKERLLKAYFEEGLNVDDPETLLRLSTELGLDAAAVRQTLDDPEAFAQEVRHDEYQARQIGVRGVPYFVFEDKYAVSGAQPTELFREVLDKVWEESRPARPVPTSLADGPTCGPDGAC